MEVPMIIDHTETPREIVIDIVEEYLKNLKTAQWGKSYNVRDPKQRKACAEWLVDGLILHVTNEIMHAIRTYDNHV